MHDFYDKEKYSDLSDDHINWITEKKIYVLPFPILNRAIVEIIILNGRVIIESQHHPIRYGRHCGSQVHLGDIYGRIDVNPKFIWNGKEWLLNTFGSAIFSEIEINQQE